MWVFIYIFYMVCLTCEFCLGHPYMKSGSDIIKPLLAGPKAFIIIIVEVKSLYYIAGVAEDGSEVSCDFGFDMIERIILDDILIDLPERIMESLVTEKRFSYFGSSPGFVIEDLKGKKIYNLLKYNLDISREVCLATVVARENLIIALRRAMIKVINQPLWRCGRGLEQPDLFNNVVVYNPQLLRSMLGREKYGIWDHGEDRTRALRVLYKLLDFLYEKDNLVQIIFYNELICPHWEASGEICFNNKGELTAFKYFGEGNGQSYKYYPEMEIWHRK